MQKVVVFSTISVWDEQANLLDSAMGFLLTSQVYRRYLIRHGQFNCFFLLPSFILYYLLLCKYEQLLPNLNRTFVLVYTFIFQSVYIHLNFTCIGKVTHINSFLDLISTYNVSKLPNLNRTFVLVYTFIFQSFII